MVDRRVEPRILVHVPIEITIDDGKGQQHTERTFIEDVSDFGCRLSTRGPVQMGDTISFKILGPRGRALPDAQPRLFQIMWVAPKPTGFTVGARLIQGEKLVELQDQEEMEIPESDDK
jgi:PilZ domain